MMQDFSGLGVAMVTPFRENGGIDHAAAERLVEHLVTNGVDSLIVHGTTGETPTLTKQEKHQSLEAIAGFNRSRARLVLGVGGNSTAQVITDLEAYDLSQVDGILSVGPYYNKPTQAGYYAHFKAIAQASLKPIILYNVPGRTGSNISAETTLRLANDMENIVAVKEASGDLDQIGTIIKDRPSGFQVLSGDDALTLPIMAMGGEGVISVVGNAFPAEFKRLVTAVAKGDLDVAREEHYRLIDLIGMLFAEGNPGGIKEVLHNMGICDRRMRLPLVNVSERTRDRIYASMANAELIKL